MNMQIISMIESHESFLNSGQAEIYRTESEGLEDVREIFCFDIPVFEDKKKNLLIYDFKNRFEIYTCYSGYIEKSIFRTHSPKS